MTTYLITESYFKSRTSVSKQLDANSIKKVFTMVEEFYVKELLGIPLYEFYKTHVNEQPTTQLSELQEQLLQKVMYYYALMAEWEVLFNLFDISDKGNIADDKLAPIELVKLKRGEVLSKAEQLKSGIISFLNTNKDGFSNYFPSNQINQARAEAVFPIVFDHAPKYYYGI